MSDNVIRLLNFIKPLTGKENWIKWKSDIKILLNSDGSWIYVSGEATLPKSNTTNASELEKIQMKLGTAAMVLKLACGDEPRRLVDEETDAIAIFARLKKQYEANTPAARMALRRSLYHITHEASRPVGEFTAEIRSIIGQLTAINCAPKADEVRDIVLMNLHPKFAVIQALLAQKEKNNSDEWTLNTLEDELTAFESSLLQHDQSDSVVSAAAVSTPYHVRIRQQHRSRSPSSDNWTNVKGLANVCERCGHGGHSSRHCFRDMPEHVKDRIRHTPKESANLASISPLKTGPLTISSLQSYVKSGHIVSLYPTNGAIFKDDNLVARVHYNNSDMRVERDFIPTSYYSNDGFSSTADGNVVWSP